MVAVKLIQVRREVLRGDLLSGGDQVGVSVISELNPCPPVIFAVRYIGLPSVSSMPWITGLNGSGVTVAPASAAIDCAATSACWEPSPPCLIGKSIASPAA